MKTAKLVIERMNDDKILHFVMLYNLPLLGRKKSRKYKKQLLNTASNRFFDKVRILLFLKKKNR